MANIINDDGFDILFRQARTYNGWLKKDVSDVQLQAAYDLTKFGATSANSSPARFVFVKSAEMKEKLISCVGEGNKNKIAQAPVTVLIGCDNKFYEKLDKLFPHDLSARSWFEGNQDAITSTASRNSTLQGAYLMLAARALGLDCGPMSGFDKEKLDKVFFPEENLEVNFICSLGYGDKNSIFPRSPRLSFNEACSII
jgi:nitroreductase